MLATERLYQEVPGWTEQLATLLEVGLRLAPGTCHGLVKARIEVQTIPRQRNITGRAVLLSDPSHAHGRGGTDVCGIILDYQHTAGQTILA